MLPAVPAIDAGLDVAAVRADFYDFAFIVLFEFFNQSDGIPVFSGRTVQYQCFHQMLRSLFLYCVPGNDQKKIRLSISRSIGHQSGHFI
jgi:hypothetical protein